MLTTKQFADLCSTTKKTIIHYDRINLLKPVSYHHALHTTFRLYEPKQVLQYQKIFMLKSFGLSLQQIKECVNDEECFNKVFKERRQVLSMDKINLENKLKKIDEYLEGLKNSRNLVVPKIKKLKPYYIYAIERSGRYVDIKKFDAELSGLIGDKNFVYPYITIFTNQTFSPEKDRMTVGAVVGIKKPKDIQGVTIMKIGPYKALTYVHVGSYSYLSFIWQFLDKYVYENNLTRDPNNLVREFYLKGQLAEPDEHNLITEIQIPIL